MPQTETVPRAVARPAIDLALPSHIKTATFALG